MVNGKEDRATKASDDNEYLEYLDRPTIYRGPANLAEDKDDDYLPPPRVVCQIGLWREEKRARGSLWTRLRRWFNSLA